jgi:recombination protein RecA
MAQKKGKEKAASSKVKSAEFTLKAAEDAVKKKFGAGAAMFLSDIASKERDVVSTGSIGLDYATGVGGITRGQMIEIYGNPASGKSTLAFSICAHAQKKFTEDVLYIDAEHCIDPKLLISMGVDPKRMVVVDKDTAEENLTVAQTFIKTGQISVVVVDSVAALLPQAEFDADYEDQFMGLHARLMSRMCRTIKPLCSKTNTAFILINQTRDNIGGYGSPKVTTGGHAIKFFADTRIEVKGGSKSTWIVDKLNGELIGHTSDMMVVKNKRGRPFRSCSVDLIYGVGYDTTGELLNIGEDMGLVDVAGSWISYKDMKAQGKEKAKLFLRKNTTVCDELKKEVQEILKG